MKRGKQQKKILKNNMIARIEPTHQDIIAFECSPEGLKTWDDTRDISIREYSPVFEEDRSELPRTELARDVRDLESG